MRSRSFFVLAFALTLALVFPPLTACAQQTPIRLSTSKWRVDPGDSYTLNWMEQSGVNASDSDYVLEELDPHFKDKDKTQSWPIHGAHHKSLENEASFSHLVRYYRIRATAWVRGMDGSSQNQEDVVSNVVRVTLVGTSKAMAVPQFADDPEMPARKSSKGGKDDKDKKDDKDAYPTAPGGPDLVITKILLSPREPKAGQRFEVHVVIKNQGVVPSAATSVRVQLLGRTFENDIEGLKPQATEEIPLPPQVADEAGPMLIKAVVDPNDRVTESREDNNDFSQTYPIGPADPKPQAKDDKTTTP